MKHADENALREQLAKALELADLNDQRAKEWERLAQEALARVAEIDRVRP